MANYSDQLPTYIKADNEDQLQKALRNVALESGKLIRPLAVYPKGSSIVCWFILDLKNVGLAKTQNESIIKKKKVTKKKAK